MTVISATQRWSYIKEVVGAEPEHPVGDDSKRNPHRNSQIAEQAMQASEALTSRKTVEEMMAESRMWRAKLGITDPNL